MNCEKCGCSHDGKYGSGRFCTSKCARSFSTSSSREEISKKTSDTIKNSARQYERTCKYCKSEFLTRSSSVVNRRCSECARFYRSIKSGGERRKEKTFMDLSSRTRSKILHRMKAHFDIKCVICFWKEATCDIHHILPKKRGGSDEASNLVVLCPNCHRLAHSGKLDSEVLFEKSIKAMWPNDEWLEQYFPHKAGL